MPTLNNHDSEGRLSMQGQAATVASASEVASITTAPAPSGLAAEVPTPLFQGKLLLRMLRRKAKRLDAGLSAISAKAEALLEKASKNSGAPLSPTIAAQFTAATGAHVSDVDVITGADAAEAAEAVDARAFTLGKRIYFGANQYRPETKEGQHIIYHELWHTHENRHGTTATAHQPLTVSAPGDAEELAADRVADWVTNAAAIGTAAAPMPMLPASGGFQAGVLHRSPTSGASAVKVKETDFQRKENAELLNMTLNEFDVFTRAQVDWHTSLKDAERPPLRALREFVSTDALLIGCYKMKVQALVDTKLDADTKKYLKTYSAAVDQSTPTVQIESTDDVTTALDWGKALSKLNKEPGGVFMRHILKKEKFIDFVANNRVDPFISYVKVCKPILSAEGQAALSAKDEIWSFTQLLLGGPPNRYHGVIRHVRNYHHFENDALEQLKANEPVTNDPQKSKKPFTLILHSGLDHNAAFHQDPNVTQVIKDARNFSILVEGATSLGALQAQIKPLAKKYGGGKVNQAMICGHGGPRGMQLAGDVAVRHNPKNKSHADDHVAEASDGLELSERKQKVKTDAFLKELLGVMSKDPKDEGRIVLNACLTNAAELPDSVYLDPDDKEWSKKQILQNESLTKHVQELANAQKKNVKAMGSNASFGQVGMQDAAGNLDILDQRAKPDFLTADKPDYVEKGLEPEGAIRAVLQVWAENEAECMKRIDARLTSSVSTVWSENLIQTMYRSVKAHQNDAAWINMLCSNIRFVAHANNPNDCRVRRVWGVSKDFANLMFPELKKTDSWSNRNYVPLVFYQVWLIHDKAHAQSFLDALGAFATCAEARNYVDERSLQQYSEVKLKDLLSPGYTDNNNAKFKLAVLVFVDGDDSEATAFLKALWQKEKGFAKYQSLLKDVKAFTEFDELFQEKPHSEPPKASSAPEPDVEREIDANADLDKDSGKKNETYLEPFFHAGTVAVAARVREKADRNAKIVKNLYPGDTVHIIGKSGPWYAIEQGAATAFIHSKLIRLN